MTKRWSSTKSLDGYTKRQASKRYRREFVAEVRRADKEPPEATFDNFEDMMTWLNDEPQQT